MAPDIRRASGKGPVIVDRIAVGSQVATTYRKSGNTGSRQVRPGTDRPLLSTVCVRTAAETPTRRPKAGAKVRNVVLNREPEHLSSASERQHELDFDGPSTGEHHSDGRSGVRGLAWKYLVKK